MKKTIAIALIIFTVICCFTACRKSEPDDSDTTTSDIKVVDFNTTRTPEESTTIKPNKNITINVPSVLAESHADGNLEQYAATYGYKIEKEEDGSVTMKMDGITYSLMLSNIGMEVMMSLGDIVDGNDFPYAVRLQDYNQDFSYILMLVDTKEYKFRTISVLNSVIPRLYAYSSTYTDKGKGRTAPRQLSTEDYANPDFEQSIPLDDVLSLSLLPYYLAAQLLSAENEALSAWFMNMYRENFNDIRNKSLSDFEQISTPYGLF